MKACLSLALLFVPLCAQAELWGYVDGSGVAHVAPTQVDSRYRLVLGNAAAVEVQQAGSTVDLTPYKRANVARFTVSSDGSLAPVAD